MSTDLNHLLDTGSVEGRRFDLLLGEPVTSKTDKIGGESGATLLEQESLGGADLEMMHLEDILAFLDASLNGLAGVVVFDNIKSRR